MSTETNQEATVEPVETEAAEGTNETAEETISLSKAEHAKLLEQLGSLKRENKDFKKAKESAQEPSKPDASDLSQKAFLRAAAITSADEVELALTTAKKWDMPIDQLVDDDDFKEKLDKFRTKKSNEAASSNIRGSGAGKSANQTAEYYIAKGAPPTAEQVPDRKVRASIARAMMANQKQGKQFYNS